MLQTLLRWLIPIVACLVVGPLAGLLTHGLRGVDGGDQTTLLVNTSPWLGLAAGLAALALAGVTGVVASAAIGPRLGLFSAGLVLTWAAFGTGRIDGVLTVSPGAASPMGRIALEGVIVGGMGVIIAAAILLMPVRRAAMAPAAGTTPAPRDPHPVAHFPEPRKIVDASALPGLGASLVVFGVVVWLAAQSTYKGQTIASAALAAMMAGVALRVVAVNASAVWVFVGAALLSTASPLAASWAHTDLTRAALGNDLLRLAKPLPLDYLAGALLGAPMGLAWGASMVVKHQDKA
jgi:hypothetical protein